MHEVSPSLIPELVQFSLLHGQQLRRVTLSTSACPLANNTGFP